jgi:RimJ/RimL family protein N-acetyltransferase
LGDGLLAVGRHAALRPLLPGDYELIFALEHESYERVVAYRNRGRSVPLEAYGQVLWEGVLFQAAICSAETGAFVGLCTCYEPNHVNRTAKIGAIAAPGDGLLQAAAGEGTRLFIDLVFRSFDFRKLYADCLRRNLSRFASALDGLAQAEATFVAHEFVDGSYEDLVVLALWREQWFAARAPSAQPQQHGQIDYPEFAARLADLGLDATFLSDPTTRLDQLALDSLAYLTVLDLIEGDQVLPDDALAVAVTLDDCFHLYNAAHRRDLHA